jgi:hypothetical protein
MFVVAWCAVSGIVNVAFLLSGKASFARWLVVVK